jgi:hypothetical protein
MAIHMECMLNPRVLSAADREQFYRERTPPPGFKVWVATMESYEEETRTTPITLESAPELGGRTQAYLATFRMLHLVVQVLRPLHEDVQPEHSPEARNVVQQAWPRQEPLEWPLLPSGRWLRSEDDYIALLGSFRSEQIAHGENRAD